MAFGKIKLTDVILGLVLVSIFAFIFLGKRNVKLHTPSGMANDVFTRESISGSADPLSEGMDPLAGVLSDEGANFIRSGTPAPAGKPLVDLSVMPMKRQIPPSPMERSPSTHRGR